MKRFLMRAGVLAGALLLCLATSASAAALLTETFSYSDGDLTAGNGGGPVGGDVSGGLWVNHSGTGSYIQVVGGQVFLEQGSGSREDANRAFAARGASDVTWAGFKLKVSSGAISLGAGDYFAHLRSTADFVYPARVHVAGPGAGGDYRLGIQITSGGPAIVFWPADLSFDTYYNVVTKYDAGAGTATLFINPVTDGSAHVTSSGGAVGDLVNTYALRQGSGNTCEQVIDDLVVGESLADLDVLNLVPGVSVAGMLLLASLLLGAGALFVVRRRSALA